MVLPAAGGTYVSPSNAHQVGIPGRYRSLAVTEGMPQPVPSYPPCSLALILSRQEG